MNNYTLHLTQTNPAQKEGSIDIGAHASYWDLHKLICTQFSYGHGTPMGEEAVVFDTLFEGELVREGAFSRGRAGKNK